MAFDPNKPVEGSPLDAAEMRSQLTGLNDFINDRPTGSDVTTEIRALAAKNVDAVAALGLTVSNPPTQAQMQTVVNKLNELINALHQPQV